MEHKPAEQRIVEINKKNEGKGGYSLGDSMLLARFEKELAAAGWSKNEIEALSPSFYLK